MTHELLRFAMFAVRAVFEHRGVRIAGTHALVSVCLRQQFVLPFSPSAVRASLQTSTVQVRNRTTGAAVSLIKKSDVKNHLSLRYRTRIHVSELESQPDATGFSAAEPDAIQATPFNCAGDSAAQHLSSGTALAQGDPLSGSVGSQAHATSNCVQP